MRAVAHCGECHTPRNILGGIKRSHWFTGAEKGKGPEGEGVPNIRSEKGRGIHNWSTEQIVTYLESGEDPDGDYAGSLMFDVVDQGMERLSNSDIEGFAAPSMMCAHAGRPEAAQWAFFEFIAIFAVRAYHK